MRSKSKCSEDSGAIKDKDTKVTDVRRYEKPAFIVKRCGTQTEVRQERFRHDRDTEGFHYESLTLLNNPRSTDMVLLGFSIYPDSLSLTHTHRSRQ